MYALLRKGDLERAKDAWTAHFNQFCNSPRACVTNPFRGDWIDMFYKGMDILYSEE